MYLPLCFKGLIIRYYQLRNAMQSTHLTKLLLLRYLYRACLCINERP
jgi:hypothetical protein